jgi:hypothetical protein
MIQHFLSKNKAEMSRPKALLVARLSQALEVSPPLAHRLCGIVLAVWPGVRKA